MAPDLARVARNPRRWHMTRFPLHGGVIEEDKTSADVERMLAAAERRQFHVHVAPWQIAITRPSTAAKWMLRPQRHDTVSAAQWRDLAYLADIDAKGTPGLVVRVTENGLRVGGLFGQLGTVATHVLIERGWLLLPDSTDDRAHVSRAGFLNLERYRAAPPPPKTARDMVRVPGHRTEAYLGAPVPNAEQHYLYRANGTIRGYYDRQGAGARCECGWTVAESSLTEARGRARQHRIEQREKQTDCMSILTRTRQPHELSPDPDPTKQH